VTFFAGEGHVFHELQVEVTYRHAGRHAGDEWKGYKPVFADETLPKTIGKLQQHQPVAICLCGDSISAGFNASGFAAFAAPVPPFQPPYPELVREGLEAAYHTTVTLKDFAIAGRASGSWQEDAAWVGEYAGEGARATLGSQSEDAAKVARNAGEGTRATQKPDLVIIAYGMNDVMMHDPGLYKANIANLMQKIRETNPQVEFLLVASMIGNDKWLTRADQFPLYRDALRSLTGPGVAMADMTAIWGNLLERKKFHDMTGNGLNHPNDFGHRLYAQAILGLLAPVSNTHR
jgi:acyl-CoA thioesterase I